MSRSSLKLIFKMFSFWKQKFGLQKFVSKNQENQACGNFTPNEGFVNLTVLTWNNLIQWSTIKFTNLSMGKKLSQHLETTNKFIIPLFIAKQTNWFLEKTLDNARKIYSYMRLLSYWNQPFKDIFFLYSIGFFEW